MEDSRKLHEKAQLDKSEREEIEDVVYEMRERVESYYRHVVEEEFDLDSNPEDEVVEEKREELLAAIERELTEDKSWEKALDLYIKGVGYTLVNRLAALRCMEVRDFIDREVTQFRESRTPAADPLVEEKFMDDNKATIEAYKRECDRLADEIKILFDMSDPYSVLDPEYDIFKDLCNLLDKIDDELWLADDVLGWVYEYYNAPDLKEVRDKADNEGLTPEDTTVANQFYTPHWVVRMLADNSLGKLFLEEKGSLIDTVKKQQELFGIEKRKNRSTHSEDSPSVTELCTYMVPTEEEGGSTSFNDPEKIRVFDPACGSGHFLLYSFDILERIWWEERPDVERKEVPTKILENNLFGVDLDLRACQLAAFNLYLKARTRAEAEGKINFTMPQVGIVCADNHIANLDKAEKVFEEVAEEHSNLLNRLEEILKEFQETPGLGSLLDVKGKLSDEFVREESQWELNEFDRKGDPYTTLESFLNDLHSEIEKHYSNGSFLANDIQSFLKLVLVLSQDYDVALMNPPYGARGRMPDKIQEYVNENYIYSEEYYINFYEVCNKILKKNGRIGMLVPSSFMFKRSFEKFRRDFVSKGNKFDFLAEFGLGILDNATVNTVGTVLRKNETEEEFKGKFIRLHDIDTYNKETIFLKSLYDSTKGDIRRIYTRKSSEFSEIEGAPISYWVPGEIRELFSHHKVIDKNYSKQAKDSAGIAKVGLQTGSYSRFLRFYWEINNKNFKPYAKGGSEAWIIPKVKLTANWDQNGKEVKRYEGSYPRNDQHYFKKVVSFNNVKTKDGRRFGLLKNSIFSTVSYAIIPSEDPLNLIGYLNSYFATYLMLAQTTDRHWQISEIGKLPYLSDINKSNISENVKECIKLIKNIRMSDFKSRIYDSPEILRKLDAGKSLEFTNNESENCKDILESAQKRMALKNLTSEIKDEYEDILDKLNNNFEKMNDIIYDIYEVDNNTKAEILKEINLRLGEDPESPELLNLDLKDRYFLEKTLVHIIIEGVENDKDGIIILKKETSEEETDLMELLKNKFGEIWGEYAEDRLAEADQILGDRQSGDEAYPNIQHWLKNELFEFHLQEFENTPIIWKLTTDRLVSDPEGTGFACLIDYHQLDEDIFDTLKSRYLEPRKSALREKRKNADQRRSNPTLDASEQAEATDEYNRCQSALRQINELEQKMKELSQIHERDWSEENQKKAEKLVPKVREFRERLEERLSTLDELRETADDDWLEDTFSPTFFDRVDDNREEWIDALKDLEKGCRAYSDDKTTPVEAHLYDLFPYFTDKLTGTTHYGSNGIFFINYYFSKGQEYLEDGEPREGMSEHLRLFAELAAETDQDVELGEEIIEDCKELEKAIPSDWKDRALSEVLTGGYTPVQKHGVAINIEPLAKKNIVPKIVEDKVIL